MPRTQSGTRKKRKVLSLRGATSCNKESAVKGHKLSIKKRHVVSMFALDTNILMTKPDAMFDFHEHDIFIPWEVLLELDKNKQGVGERSMNARRSIALLLYLAESVPMKKISNGIPLVKPGESGRKKKRGRLFFHIPCKDELNEALNDSIPDHRILKQCLYAKKSSLVLVTKDKMMRIFALLVGIPAEDYLNDAVDVENLRSTGVYDIPNKLWDARKKAKNGTFELTGKELCKVTVNEFLSVGLDSSQNLRVVEKVSPHKVCVRHVVDYQNVHSVFGVRARNKYQNYALNVLMDPNISVVILEGPAGSGKNFLTLAAAFHQTFDCKITRCRGPRFKPYRRIIATRDAVPVGREIGFKPGSEKSKMEPWLGGVLDNVSQLVSINDGVQGLSKNKLMDLLELKELNSMRGRSFYRDFLIFDEAQNSFREQLKLFLTRVGDGCKVVCLGNFSQTDISLAGRTSGLERVIDITRDWKNSAHIVLPTVERGNVAEFFEANL